MLTEFMLGSTPDILAYAMFNWYQPVWYHEPEAQFPYEKKVKGQWVVPTGKKVYTIVAGLEFEALNVSRPVKIV